MGQRRGHRGHVATTAIYLYGCHDAGAEATIGVRRAIIATLALAGPRVTELCQLDNQDVDLTKARIQIRDAKTQAGVRAIDIQPRLLDELARHRANRGPAAMDAPAFPTRVGTRRDKDNVRQRVIQPVLQQANQLRAERDQPPIHVHVTPHTFRRTYITYMLAGGYDLPYVQDQVGHRDPTTTLAIYAQVIRRPDRDQVQAEIRALLHDTPRQTNRPSASAEVSFRPTRGPAGTQQARLQKAGNGRAIHL